MKMPNWTKEQELAITKSGMNIIVSAGAGSGKTAVLTERVIRKLKNGEDVSRLLILTFTNAAAKEMKDRIRKAIIEEKLDDELPKIDSSYITTFDSFALAIVKKYHYLLNISSKVEIANDLILKWKKEELLDTIFEELYQENDEQFHSLLKDFTIRDDNKLKEYILEIYDKLDLEYDKITLLDNYFDNFFNDKFIENSVIEFEDLLQDKILKIKENLAEIELRADGDFTSKLYESLKPIIENTDYDLIKEGLSNLNIPRLGKNMSSIKPFKEKISTLRDTLKNMMIYESKSDIYNMLLKTKNNIQIIIKILKELDERFLIYKNKEELYDFLDISKMAIKIVKEHSDIASYLKNYFHEILIDEYQDTSDIQEYFISFIANNNVYMVGDIKQSIYRFRNANPNLFKDKYNNYQNEVGGYKIDLVKNFRSREETLANINYIFNYIMDLDIGGADYKNFHQMVFGNSVYNEFNPSDQDNNFEIYNYELSDKNFDKNEVEAFIVAKDILDKVNSGYQVYDKDLKRLRPITFSDFVILIDKSKSFDLYKKIFEYKGINLTIIKDESIKGNADLFILKNILVLIKNYLDNSYKEEFKYAYLSIGRSYLFSLSDEELYERITNNNFKDDKILEHIKNLCTSIETISPSKLIENILDEFNFYEKLITVGNINESIIRFDYLSDLVSNLENLSYTYIDILEYLKKMIENDEEIKYSLNKDTPNSVKIMTIHKSKGLEYHVCYYTGLTNAFNVKDAKKRFLYDSKYGIVIPVFDEGVKNTIWEQLYKNNYIKEDISERIRLFYVALTRAKEKMILVTTLTDDVDTLEDGDSLDQELIELDTRLKYKSFSSILNSIKDKLSPYIKNINLDDYKITKDYNSVKEENVKEKVSKTNDKITVQELNILDIYLKEEKFSKTIKSFITKSDREKLDFGTMMHYFLEITDFKKPNYEIIPSIYQEYIKKFLKSNLLKNIKDATIYKEYEFIEHDLEIKKHGIIDLMLEYDSHIDIIDYKLKNIDDNLYDSQLKGYKDYIKTKTNKEINLYLYSIIDNTYRQID